MPRTRTTNNMCRVFSPTAVIEKDLSGDGQGPHADVCGSNHHNGRRPFRAASTPLCISEKPKNGSTSLPENFSVFSLHSPHPCAALVPLYPVRLIPHCPRASIILSRRLKKNSVFAPYSVTLLERSSLTEDLSLSESRCLTLRGPLPTKITQSSKNRTTNNDAPLEKTLVQKSANKKWTMLLRDSLIKGRHRNINVGRIAESSYNKFVGGLRTTSLSRRSSYNGASSYNKFFGGLHGKFRQNLSTLVNRQRAALVNPCQEVRATTPRNCSSSSEVVG